MVIQPVSTNWKHTSDPVHSYQQSQQPHPKADRPFSEKKKPPSDEVTVSDRSYQRLQNHHSPRKLEPIRDAREAQAIMDMIKSKMIEQTKTTMYAHDVIPNSTVLNLLSPAHPISNSVDIQIHDFSKKAP